MKITVLLLCVLGLNLAAFAGPETFDFKDPKGPNNARFKSVAPTETIEGVATNISGTVTFDPANPGGLKGKIIVEASSLHVPIALMQTHLHSAMWLDVTKYPQISFETVSVDNVKTEGDTTTADVTGTFTLHGVSKKMTAPVKIRFLKDKLQERPVKIPGDLLVIHADFILKRSDFAINAGKYEDKVANDLHLTLDIAGQSPH